MCISLSLSIYIYIYIYTPPVRPRHTSRGVAYLEEPCRPFVIKHEVYTGFTQVFIGST